MLEVEIFVERQDIKFNVKMKKTRSFRFSTSILISIIHFMLNNLVILECPSPESYVIKYLLLI